MQKRGPVVLHVRECREQCAQMCVEGARRPARRNTQACWSRWRRRPVQVALHAPPPANQARRPSGHGDARAVTTHWGAAMAGGGAVSRRRRAKSKHAEGFFFARVLLGSGEAGARPKSNYTRSRGRDLAQLSERPLFPSIPGASQTSHDLSTVQLSPLVQTRSIA